ncbi:MAG TPA: NAD(P)/FAD-dependent oxidoreductase [Bryobacteraceae bacterium]|nr:NAD(P)/FAD-dependent oxidoreductase [Bryobacteraceae bacterium]
MKHRVVIVGGGFGGLRVAQGLARAPVEVTLVDRRNHHLFQPLLYQVATGGLSPGEIASPLRYILNRNKNTRVLLAEAVDIDVEGRKLILDSGGLLPYETLVVAAGAVNHYFGKPWDAVAPGLKSIEEATEIRSRVLGAFEQAEKEPDPEKRAAWLTFTIIGGGPTGVELAGALGEIANDTLRHDFRVINPAESRIILLEGSDRILGSFPPDLSESAERQLIRLGVRTRTKVLATEIDPEGVTIKVDGSVQRIPSRTVLWAAGVKASPLGALLEKKAGATLDRGGRAIVGPDLSLPGHPEILVIGDMASFSHQGGKPLPGVAPVAMQQGTYAAKLIVRRLQGRPVKPFHYFDKGNLATIGRRAAVADLGPLHFSGLFAWLAWLFVHLMYLVGFQNRLLVLIEWVYDYITRNRGARLITGK